MMSLNEADVKTGIGSMMFEIWNLQKQLKEVQTELAELKAAGTKKEANDTPDNSSRTVFHRTVGGSHSG
jgi:hypothetical protein